MIYTCYISIDTPIVQHLLSHGVPNDRLFSLSGMCHNAITCSSCNHGTVGDKLVWRIFAIQELVQSTPYGVQWPALDSTTELHLVHLAIDATRL